jgi:hypothetical protein
MVCSVLDASACSEEEKASLINYAIENVITVVKSA